MHNMVPTQCILAFRDGQDAGASEGGRMVILTINVAWLLTGKLNGRVKIWRKQHESVAPSCPVSTVQAAGAMMV